MSISADKPRAVVLLSGGLDSATTLAIARDEGHDCYALSVHYGQRHVAELDAAARVARALGAVEHKTMGVDLAGLGGSALTDLGVDVPNAPSEGIPVTYVPARNTLMLSLALGYAEVRGAQAVYVGVNAVDYSAIRTAGRSSSRPLHGWPRSRRRRGWRGAGSRSSRHWHRSRRPRSSGWASTSASTTA